MDKGEQISIQTGDVTQMGTFEEFFAAYEKQMDYMIRLLVNADNAIDVAHAERCPLPFLSSMVEDCIHRGKSVQEGGAVYNFTGPQGFGVANMADALYAVKTLVYDEKKISMAQLKEALENNYGKDMTDGHAEQITSEVAKELLAQGRTVTQEEIASIFRSVKANPASPEKRRNMPKSWK